MGGVNPLAALGAVAGGYVEQSRKQKELAIAENYKNALIEHNKAEAKYKEKQIEKMAAELQFKQGLFDQLKPLLGGGLFQGVPGAPPAPGMAPMQPSSPEGMGYPGGPRPMMPQGQPQAQVGPSNYDPLIQKYAQQYGVDPNLVRSIIKHESSFNPQATSPKGAQGLMQLMPGTAQAMGVQNAYDPDQNVMGGTKYLAQLIQQFGGDIPKAVAAYNAGPGRVQSAGGIPRIPETQGFVKNVMGTYQSFPQMVAQGQMQNRMGQVTTDQAGAQGQAQPQTKGDVSQLPYGARLMMDMLFHQSMDKFDPKLREASPEYKWLDLGTHFQAVDKQGRVAGTIPKSPEYNLVETVDPRTGRKYSIPWNRYKPTQTMPLQPGGVPTTQGPGGPQAVPGFVKELGEKELAPKIPKEVEQKIATELDPIGSQLDWLTQNAKSEYFGWRAQIKAAGLENKFLAEGIQALGKMGWVNVPEGFQDWYKTLWRLQNKEIHEFAGATMTYNEMNRVIKQLANANSPESFAAGAEATRRATQAYKASVYDFYSKPEAERAAEAAKGSKPSLDLGKKKPKRMRYDPATGNVIPAE